MRFVIQRVTSANVLIDQKIYSSIKTGILLLIGIEEQDSEAEIDYYAQKIVNMRIFNDHNHKMNFSLLNIKGSILVVSQFK